MLWSIMALACQPTGLSVATAMPTPLFSSRIRISPVCEQTMLLPPLDMAPVGPP